MRSINLTSIKNAVKSNCFAQSNRLHKENVRKTEQLVLQKDFFWYGSHLNKKYILVNEIKHFSPKREKKVKQDILR